MWHATYLSLPERFQFLECARPVVVQQARERAVGEQAAAGLALRAIVSLVARIAYPLNLSPAARTRLPVAPMHGHLGPKRGHLLGKPAIRLGAKAVGPFDQSRAGRFVYALDFLRAQLLRHRDWRKLRTMQYLVGI